MINFHKDIVKTLTTILPTHYEMILHRGLSVPCISYMELGNAAAQTGDTLGYSTIQYQVKVWADRIEDLQTYASKVDDALRVKGWKRVATNELHDKESTMMQKIMTFEAIALENFNN